MVPIDVAQNNKVLEFILKCGSSFHTAVHEDTKRKMASSLMNVVENCPRRNIRCIILKIQGLLVKLLGFYQVLPDKLLKKNCVYFC